MDGGQVATARAAAPSPTAPAGLPHQPALDGLRAIAVIAVLLFHGGFGWMSGGYLGVSVFFTLSGFLITSLLAAEIEAQGSVRIGRFLARRVRRLLPASCLCLLIIVAAAQLGAFDRVPNLRRDVVGAALHAANWSQLTAGSSYADLFRTGTSPVAHFWSLAIEEQFYLVWPAAFVLLARRTGRTGVRCAVLLAAVPAAAIPTITSWRWRADAVYLGTPSRAAELLIGAALALVLASRPALPDRARWLAACGGAIVVVLFVVTPSGRGWPYAGGLPLFALVSAALIAGLQVDGPVRRALAARPLAAVGRISYGIYLFHWPVFVVLDVAERGLGRFVPACLITAVLAVGSAALVEQPIRRGRPRVRRDLGVALLAMSGVVVAATWFAPGRAEEIGVIDPERAAAVAIQPLPSAPPTTMAPETSTVPTGAVTHAVTPGGTDATAASTTSPPPPPVRILVVGDSTSLTFGKALTEWAFANPGVAQVQPMGLGGCGFVPEGLLGTVVDLQREECTRRIDEEIPQAIASLQPDLVVVSINLADSWDRSLDGGRTYVRPDHPSYAALIEQGYRRFFEMAISAGAGRVVWLDPPLVPVIDSRTGELEDAGGAIARRALIDTAITAASAAHPHHVRVLPYAGWLAGSGLLDDPANRPDGIHLTDEAAQVVADDWMGPALVDLWREGR